MVRRRSISTSRSVASRDSFAIRQEDDLGLLHSTGQETPRRRTSAPKPQGFGDESDKAQEIRDLFQDLYDLLKRDDPEEYAKVIQKRGQLLSRRLNREEIQRRLLLMVAKEHGLRIGEGGDVTPRHRGLHTPPTASGSYTPLVPGFTHKGKDTLLFGSSGTGKTLAALGLSYAAATGHAPFLDIEHGTAQRSRSDSLDRQ